jgi:DNA-binding IclR family transcriptional regulator
MTAAAAVAHLLAQYPALPPEAAPVYFLLCAHEHLTAQGIARRLDMAQSTALRLLALLSDVGLINQTQDDTKAARWRLTSAGKVLAQTFVS